jgi:hypothetical protein
VPNPSLLDFVTSSGRASVADYQYLAVGLQFSCEVKIAIRESPFGSKTTTFRSKKLAQRNAAKEAVQWLKENGYINDDGRPVGKKRKTDHPVTPEALATADADNDSPTPGLTYGKEVNG